MFKIFYSNNEPFSGKGLIQKHGDRYLIHNPPSLPVTSKELDDIYELGYERDAHPFCRAKGKIRALETIKYSITGHRGCFGECSFCAISIHQGNSIVSRSEKSIINEVKNFIKDKNFKGIIYDIGGPTANMYGMGCGIKNSNGKCNTKKCLLDNCTSLLISHERQIDLLDKILSVKGVKKVFISSGIRYDLILKDKEFGGKYLEKLVKYHISGQLKIAPEHSEEQILNLMGKPPISELKEFIKKFNNLNKKFDKKNFLTYYFIAAHPGCSTNDMLKLKNFINKELKISPEQVQIFTPTPSTYSTLMYYTEKDNKKNKKIFVEKKIGEKIRQKNIITAIKSKKI